MTEEERDLAFLSNWEQKFEEQDWNWFYGVERRVDPRSQSVRKVLAEILEKIRETVGQIVEENGLQRQMRCKTRDEVPDNIKTLAIILEEMELEVAVDDEPPDDFGAWRILESEVRQSLSAALEEAEATSGSKDLSRKAHAARAIGYLDDLRWSWDFLRKEDGEQGARWLDDAFAYIAKQAFLAGNLAAHSALKTFESDAVRGQKVLGGTKSAAKVVNDEVKKEGDRLFVRMIELVNDHRVTGAASICVAEGLSGSIDAARRSYYRRKKKV